jgi:hypothetical protein
VVEHVTDRRFYHVNQIPTNGRYPPMTAGQHVVCGTERNQYFDYFESNIRDCPVTLADDSVVMVPAVRFLRAVRNGTLHCPDLPHIAWQVANHYAMLVRELAWEMIRHREFPEAPSRRTALWLVDTFEQAASWLEEFDGFKQVVAVRATGTIHRADASLFMEDDERLPEMYAAARAYWRGRQSASPRPEILFRGELVVEDIGLA